MTLAGEGRPASAARPSGRAGGTSARNSGSMARAPGMGGDQCERHRPGAGEARERADAQQQRQRQRAGPIGADPAVAHDLELAFAVAAAAETVERVGEPVLVHMSKANIAGTVQNLSSPPSVFQPSWRCITAISSGWLNSAA